MEEEEEKKEHNKALRSTQFEFSPSESDADEEDLKIKNNLNISSFTTKNFNSRKNSQKEEKKEKKKTKENKPKEYLSRYIRMTLFFLFLTFSVLLDLDPGIIVSSYKSFTQDLNINDLQYGSLDSITTIGKIISLLIYMIIIHKNHRKFIIVITSFFHGLYFYGYFLNDNYYYIAILKFFASFCKVFINIYIPVWIDQFGIKKYKTLLLTIIHMVKPYGRIIGAWISTVIFDNDWKKASFYCGIIFFILSFCLFIIPQKYYSTKYMVVEEKRKNSENFDEKLSKNKMSDNIIRNEKENVNDIEYFNNTKKDIDENNNYKKEKLIDDKKTYEEKKRLKSLSLWNKIKVVVFNPCFIFSSFSRACLFSIFQIIHLFLKEYTFEALNYNDEITYFYYYSLTTIFAPLLGFLIGGTICNKFLGGYESKNSICIIIFFGTLALFLNYLIRNSNDFNNLILYIFGYFLSVSAFLPTISGYIIHSLNKELKGFGSSLDNLINNLLGKLPSPIVYGVINYKYKNKNPKYAWNKCLMIYYLGIIFIYLTCFFKWKLNDINKKKDELKNNNIVKKTLKDYSLNSSLIRVKKPFQKFDDNDENNSSTVELEYID